VRVFGWIEIGQRRMTFDLAYVLTLLTCIINDGWEHLIHYKERNVQA
jgi:hypothetical protein